MKIEQQKYTIMQPTTNLWREENPLYVGKERSKIMRGLIEHFWGSKGWEYFLYCYFESIGKTSFHPNHFGVDEGVAIQQHFTDVLRQTFNISSRVDLFFDRLMGEARDFIPMILAKIDPGLKSTTFLNSDVYAFPSNYHEYLELLATSEKKQNPLIAFETMRLLFIAYVLALVKKRHENEKHNMYLNYVQKTISKNVFTSERYGDIHPHTLYSVHDDETNQAVYAGDYVEAGAYCKQLKEAGKNVHIKQYPMKVRKVLYGSEEVLIHTNNRVKDETTSVLKLISKALARDGEIDMEASLDDPLGMYYVVLDPKKSTRPLERAMLMQLRHFFKNNNIPFSYHKDHTNDGRPGQSQFNRFRRYALLIDNKVKFELILYTPLDYLNSVFMVKEPEAGALPPLFDDDIPELPDYDSVVGELKEEPLSGVVSLEKKKDAPSPLSHKWNGPAHDLYKKRRVETTLRWLFPASLYGDELMLSLHEAIDTQAEKLLQANKINYEPDCYNRDDEKHT